MNTSPTAMSSLHKSISDFATGMTATRERTITQADIAAFAQVTGDDNPIHVDPSDPAAVRIGGTIAHGMLTASLISAVLGTQLPGAGAIYVSQSLSFRRPVRPGDRIVATVEIVEVISTRNRLRCRTTCTCRDELVLDGEAVLLIPEPQTPG